MDRRNFLKICALAIGGYFFAKIPRWFSLRGKNVPDLKEARFYKSADHLAG